MLRSEELEAEAQRIQKEMDWVSPAKVKCPGGCMSVDIALGYVFKGVRLKQIRRELAGLSPFQSPQV